MTPAQMKEAFTKDPAGFLSEHAVSIKATLAQHKHWMTFAENSPFKPSLKGKTQVAALTAPTASVAFSDYKPPGQHTLIRCGAASATLEIVKPDSPDAFEVHVIPYSGNKSLGVKLPPGDEPAIAITTKIDGCTMLVSGESSSPFASHSNVATPPEERTKEQFLTQHLNEIESAFKELVAEENIDSVSQNKAMFGHWDVSKDVPGAQVQYSQHQHARITHETSQGLTHFRAEKKVGHSKKIVKLDQGAVDLAKNNGAAANAFIGVRQDGIWSFHFCSFGSFTFLIIDEQKLKGWSYKSSQTKYSCIAITAHGEFWPNPNLTHLPLLPQIYNGSQRKFKGTY